MPLHLLGKKSWNVYNTANIARVRDDEAAALAREEAQEQAMQEEDAHRRLALLRGESLPSPPPKPTSPPLEQQHPPGEETYAQRDRRRKRRRGEDDTDRDIRYARQTQGRNGEGGVGERRPRALLSRAERDAPLEDHAGHIQLLPPPDEKALRKVVKNAESEGEKEAKRRREEEGVVMRFREAAGRREGAGRPWYVEGKAVAVSEERKVEVDAVLADVVGRDVWGNEDPRRREREQRRISAGDPFAVMQQAQKQLKTSERDRKDWERAQRAEVERLKSEESRRRRSRSRNRDDVESLDGFSLDAPAKKADPSRNDERTRHRHRRHHQHHRHRHCSRSRSKERDGDNHKGYKHRQRDHLDQ